MNIIEEVKKDLYYIINEQGAYECDEGRFKGNLVVESEWLKGQIEEHLNKLKPYIELVEIVYQRYTLNQECKTPYSTNFKKREKELIDKGLALFKKIKGIK